MVVLALVPSQVHARDHKCRTVKVFDGLVSKIVGRKSAPASVLNYKIGRMHSTNRSASTSLPFPFLHHSANSNKQTNTLLGQSSSTRFETPKTAPHLPIPPSKLLSELA